MKTKIIEASDGSNFNWGKFMVCRFDEHEFAHRSAVDEGRSLLRAIGTGPESVWVLDLQTREGAQFTPHGYAKADLNEKHQIWVCPMFEPFLTWLYRQDLTDLNALPAFVNLGEVETAMWGYRRKRKEEPV